MFRVVNNVLKVFNHDVALEDGTHEIYYNANTDNISVDGSDKAFIKIAEYTYSSKNKKLRIKDQLSKVPSKKSYHLPRIIANSRYNNARVAMGPLYQHSDIVQTFLEGIPVDFNYTTFFGGSIQMSNYSWIGGSICDPRPYTATGSCLSPTIGIFFGWYMMSFSPFSGWGISSFSRVSQTYVFRRYTMLQINDIDLFSFFVGGKEIKVSPLKLENDSATVPNINWKMSTFNLIQ